VFRVLGLNLFCFAALGRLAVIMRLFVYWFMNLFFFNNLITDL